VLAVAHVVISVVALNHHPSAHAHAHAHMPPPPLALHHLRLYLPPIHSQPL